MWLVWIFACSGGEEVDTDGGPVVVPVDPANDDLVLTDVVRLEVETSTGLIQLGGFDTDEVRIAAGGGLVDDGWTHEIVDGVASLYALCPGGERGCGMGFDLVVPNGLPLVLSTSAGEVTVNGHEGPLSIISQDGPVSIRERPTSQASISTRSGEVEVTFTEEPNALDVTTTLGNITVHLPGDRYEMHVETTGDVVLDGVSFVPSSPPIDLTSNAGDISVYGSGD